MIAVWTSMPTMLNNKMEFCKEMCVSLKRGELLHKVLHKVQRGVTQIVPLTGSKCRLKY